MSTKTLTNTTASQAKDNVTDLVTWGKGDSFRLICKASSKQEGWMKSTKALEIEGIGCVVQVTTQQNNNIAEALTFVPGIRIYESKDDNENVTSRKLVPIFNTINSYQENCLNLLSHVFVLMEVMYMKSGFISSRINTLINVVNDKLQFCGFCLDEKKNNSISRLYSNSMYLIGSIYYTIKKIKMDEGHDLYEVIDLIHSNMRKCGIEIKITNEEIDNSYSVVVYSVLDRDSIIICEDLSIGDKKDKPGINPVKAVKGYNPTNIDVSKLNT